MIDIDREAARREQAHAAQGNYIGGLGISGFDANKRGLVGERQFSIEFGLPMRLELNRPGGDDGIDFWLPQTLFGKRYVVPVDVKAARKPTFLISKIHLTKPRTIYVLARLYDDDRNAELLGWNWGSALLRSIPRDFGYGPNHWIEERRSIAELKARKP